MFDSGVVFDASPTNTNEYLARDRGKTAPCARPLAEPSADYVPVVDGGASAGLGIW
jgi:hypothetical protein